MICLTEGKESNDVGDKESSHQQNISEVYGGHRQGYRQDQEQRKQLKKYQPYGLGDPEDGRGRGRDVPLQNKKNYKRDRGSIVTTEL